MVSVFDYLTKFLIVSLQEILKSEIITCKNMNHFKALNT